jgi:hypothetical protein
MLNPAHVPRRFDKQGISALESMFTSPTAGRGVQNVPHIPRRRDLSVVEFDYEYRGRETPVLIEGITDDWPAFRRWSFPYLAERCGACRVVVNGCDNDSSREMSLTDFTQLLDTAGGSDKSPAYVQEWYYKDAAPGLADDIPELEIAQYDFRRSLYGADVSTNHQLSIGQRGGVTMLHQDSYMVDVIHVQLVGEKRWHVLSPTAQLYLDDNGDMDFERLLRDPATKLMQCVLRPGEALYLPALWWQRVELLSDSIGLRRKCLDPRHLQTHIRLRMAELLAVALNAEEVSRTHPELFPLVVRRARTWAQRMNIDLSQLEPD